jgi:uncharacterized protein YndB with AHSA1/START domain
MAIKITVETSVAAPIEQVWRAWNTPADIMQWNAASDDWHTTKSTVDLRVGGKFSSRMEAKDGSMGFDFEGTYTVVDDYKLIESAFGDRTLVVEFIPADTSAKVGKLFLTILKGMLSLSNRHYRCDKYFLSVLSRTVD